MQTANSIPDPLFTQVDQLATSVDLPSNESYRYAIAVMGEDAVTIQLNQIYTTEESAVDPVLWQLQLLSFAQNEW